jgi:chromosomal replication initiator protein
MNGNTTVLQRAIIGAQRIPHLKTPAANRQEREMQELLADNKSLLAQIASLAVDNTALRTQVLSLQDRIAKLVAKFPVVDGEPFAGLTFIKPRIADIIDAVSGYFEVSRIEMRGDGRRLAICRPRQIAMYLSRIMTFHSYPTIGAAFGDRDHTTVMHAHDKIAELRKIDEQLNKQITAIESQFLLPNDALDHPGRASSEPAPTSPDTLGAGLLTITG